MFPTWKRLLQLTVCPPVCSRRQSGLGEDNVLKLQCTHFSQRGQPVWEAQRALLPGASPEMPEFTVAAVMWERSQQEGGGLILLFILNQLSASLAMPFKNRQKQESGPTSQFILKLWSTTHYNRQMHADLSSRCHGYTSCTQAALTLWL